MNAINSMEKCPYQLLFGSKPMLPSRLKVFGEMGIVIRKNNILSKLRNCGMACILFGYSVDHESHVYQTLNLCTKRNINTRDIAWLRRIYKNLSKTCIAFNEQDDENEDFTDIFEALKQK
jgi:hypothetical protein